MSQTQLPGSNDAAKRRKIELLNGDLVTVEITDDRDYQATVDVITDDRRWTYGVPSDLTVQFLQAWENRRRLGDVEEPEWIDQVLRALGLE